MKHEAYGVTGGFVLPHPPVIIPGLDPAGHQADKTVQGLQQVARQIKQLNPDAIVFISPHAPMFSDYLFMYDNDLLTGCLSRFGSGVVPDLSYKQDQALLNQWIENLSQAGISGGYLSARQKKQFNVETEMDHGIYVPLFFLNEAGVTCPIAAVSSSMLERPDLFAAGKALASAAGQLEKRVVVIASGDQSHKVNAQSPYGSCPEGAIYDQTLCTAIRQSDMKTLLSMPADLCEKAAECGFRSLMMMLGALSSYSIMSDCISYEAPYGIGYCVASFLPADTADTNKADSADKTSEHMSQSLSGKKRQSSPEKLMQEIIEEQRNRNRIQQTEGSLPVRIAAEALRRYFFEKQTVSADHFIQYKNEMPALFSQKAGVFVSLKKWGQLRGCIGTTRSTTACMAEEIIRNAYQAALDDPRFEPVTVDELDDLAISVDRLGPLEPITDQSQLDPKHYGVVVRQASNSGLLLPDLEGVDSVDEQIRIACGKAGIDPVSVYDLFRFEVIRYT